MGRTLISIDGGNVLGQARRAGRKLDFVALRDCLASPSVGRQLLECWAYMPLPPNGKSPGVQKWQNYLRSQGIKVVAKKGVPRRGGRWKCDLDVRLATDALDLVRSFLPDIFVLVSGDGDLADTVQRIHRLAVHVEVVSTTRSLSEDLRRVADSYVDLSEFLMHCPRDEQPRCIAL